MFPRITGMKRADECQVHGAPARSANRTLLIMMAAALLLVIWHVWAFGPTAQAEDADAVKRSFPLMLGGEIWDLLFGRHGMAAELWDVFPYFIVGILMAGYIRTYKLATRMQLALRRHGMASVFLASLVGMITPLCACGTLTTAVSLLFAGIPLAPVMSLMVTSPLLSPSTYLLTLNDLGPEWTVIRTVAAFSMGIIAGTVTHLLRDRGFNTKEVFVEGAITRGDFHDEDYPDERLRCNCKQRFGHRVASRTDNMFVIFLAKSSEMLWVVGKYVLVGVAIGAVVERYMPAQWTYRLFGRGDALNIVWITLGSVPVFLHQISASSILYHVKSSLQGTLDGGAALAFMIGGPVTAMPTMILFWTIFKKRVFVLYMSICLLGTIAIAYAFQFLVFVPHADMGNPILRDVGAISGGPSSVIEKKGKDVRMVMDPGGKGMVASLMNDRGGEGAVVFDAVAERFMGASSVKYDNLTYVGNIATWLQQNNTSAAGRSILVYDMSPGPAPGGDVFSDKARAYLEGRGFSVTVTDRGKDPALNDGFLEKHGQLWIFFGEPGKGGGLSDAELDAISKSHSDGRGMLIVAGKKGSGDADRLAVNRLSSRFGVTFEGQVENPDEVPVSTGARFFTRASAALGSILKVFHKA